MLRAYCSEWRGDPDIPVLDPEEMHHLVRVRRIRTDETVQILNGRGDVMTCRVQHVSGKELQLRIENLLHIERTALHRHLLVALPKGKTFPTILQKAAELEIGEITPLSTETSEIAASRADRKADRWESILIEAIKQSGNPWMPVLNPARSLESALAGTSNADLRLCAALQPDAAPLINVLKECCPQKGNIAVFVGPEGDFSTSEYGLLRDAGMRFISLGPLVLKVETAASLVMGVIGAWNQAN